MKNDTKPLENVLLFSAKSQQALLQKLEMSLQNLKSPTQSISSSSFPMSIHIVNESDDFRLGIVNPSFERIAKAMEIVKNGKSCHGSQGIWYEFCGLLKNNGKLVFMFPGIDSTARVDVSDVAHYFGEELFESKKDGLLENRGIEVFYTSELNMKILSKMKVIPDAICGHSLGEWIGMVASGLSADKSVEKVISALKPGMLQVPGVVFGALGCSVEKAKKAIETLSDIEISHDNCPNQSIICGIESSIDKAISLLLKQNVICQKLNFRSGFHTSLFKPYVKPIELLFETLSFSIPKIPFWSATTCRPYPHHPSEIRALMVQHILEPVRFRELTRTLYDAGFRVFVQVGAGSLPGFVDDTLRGKPHLAVSTTVSNRTGLQQLQRFFLALFIEGANFNFDFLLGNFVSSRGLTAGTTAAFMVPAVKPRDDMLPSLRASLMTELDGLFNDIKNATLAITNALMNETGHLKPFQKEIKKILCLKDFPQLIDHCLYKQSKNWKNIKDRMPILPITGTIDWVSKIALEQFPHYKVVGIEDITAKKWLSADESREIRIRLECNRSIDNQIFIKCDVIDYFSATVVLMKEYRTAPAALDSPLTEVKQYPVPCENIYADGLLFHGPSFQCISEIGYFGTNGLDGKIKVSKVPGAILDNAGQLAGLWIMESLKNDKYAMPIRIKRISYFEPEPQNGEVECKVRVVRIRSRDIMFNLELIHQNKIWAKIEGWEKWRFECDDKFWNFLLKPGKNILAETNSSFVWFEPPHSSKTFIDELFYRYLREEERTAYQNSNARQGQKANDLSSKNREAWICGRVAAKDAVRAYLWKKGYKEEIFPAEIWIENDMFGRPFIRELPVPMQLFISISHKNRLGVANVSETLEVGIDVEQIELREKTFEAIMMSQNESNLIPSTHSDIDKKSELRAEWVTRFWSAKEAYSKAKGTGLKGNPKGLQIYEFEQMQKDILKIRVQDKWIKSTKLGSYILSETEQY